MPNGHVLNQRAHPYRVEVLHPADGWRDFRGSVDEAAQRLSDGRVYSWCPSRIYPPVTLFGFQTPEARDAFAVWVIGRRPGLSPITTQIR